MKDKVKRFFIDKKELLVFIAVVVVVFATVITIASLALSDIPANTDDPIIDNGNENNGDKPVDGENNNNNDKPEEPVVKKFALPVLGEYEVIRTFFDPNLSDEELVSAVIPTGSYMVESKGISYSKKDNSTFDVVAIYEGLVTSVVEDELLGTTITIKHSDEMVSVYSSLTNSLVKVGDNVTCGQTIASSSTSLNDVEAGVHVHLQIKVNEDFINPNNVFGKQMSELDTTK